MPFRPTLLAAACLAIAAPAAAQQLAALAPVPRPADARLTSVLDSIAFHAMGEQSIPGLSVAIVRDGQVIEERGYGTADPRDPHLATENTLYQIASVSKQFTAAAVLRLAEQGTLRLDQPVTDFVDGLPAQYRRVTLDRLLNHTAGVPNFTEFFREFHRPLTPAQLVDSLAARPLLFTPGTGFHYSNSGYYLLGLVIERATGDSYGDWMRRQFWAPLGMDDTHYCGTRPGTALPSGYARNRRGDAVRVEPWDPSVLYAAGSVCSTAADLAKWEVALGEGKVLSPASYRMMTTPVGGADPNVRMSYGFATMVDTTEAGPYLHHDGAVAGFRAQVAWYPAERLAVVVLMNQGLAAPEPIERDFARAVLGVNPDIPRFAGPSSAPGSTPTGNGASSTGSTGGRPSTGASDVPDWLRER
jgi:CubicO group peptidase (beta-lactamase class C family)